MLYISILLLVFFIIILVFVYRRLTSEGFAISTGYIEDPIAATKLKKQLVQSEIAYGNQKNEALKNQQRLNTEIKTLTTEQQILMKDIQKSKLGITTKEEEDTVPTKFFDNKELYSILINGLNMGSYNAKENLTDSYGLKNVNYRNDKSSFRRTVTDTINVACELLQQKQDYRYLSKCVDTITDIDGAAKIHNLIIKAYTFISHPKYISNRTIDPYLVNKLNKNIEAIITSGRKILFADSKTCKCKTGKNKKLLENKLNEFIQMNSNIQSQITNIETRINGSKITVPPFMANIPGFKLPNQPAPNNKLKANLKTLYQRRRFILENINKIYNSIRQLGNNETICKPC
uniref:Uncharacterized protein n=1 Tax=viral metagenome TaxID=1070528 RepID=A0A6C0B5I7_9ZZZZ